MHLEEKENTDRGHLHIKINDCNFTKEQNF